MKNYINLKDRNHQIILAVILLAIIVMYSFSLNKKEENNNVNSSDTATTTATTGVKPTTKPAQTYTADYIKIGQRTLINGIYVTPNKVTNDSRCPSNVKCIQAGEVDLGVLLEQGDTNQSIMLTTNKPVSIFWRKGVYITLTKVYPAKTTTKTINPSDYRFLITVK